MNDKPAPLLNAEDLLIAVFGEKTTPSLRWLRYTTKRRLIPHFKVGRLVRYDPIAVRAALQMNCEVKAKGLK